MWSMMPPRTTKKDRSDLRLSIVERLAKARVRPFVTPNGEAMRNLLWAGDMRAAGKKQIPRFARNDNGFYERNARAAGRVRHVTTIPQSPAVSTAGNSSLAVFSFTLALVTRITDSTTTALPAKMKPSTRSCRISQPRKTAITGFT
jgi:hypothetical protein